MTTIEEARIALAKRDHLIVEPTQLVEHALTWFGDKVAIACSFGRCSVAVLHMALQINPHVKVIFNDTGVEYRETYQHMYMMRDLWRLNLHITKAIKGFWECVREYGFPHIRGTYNEDGVNTRTPHCCYYLKEKPMRNWMKENKVQAVLTGLRASESRVRALSIHYYGSFYLSKKWGGWKIHPIAFWTKNDLLKYIERNNIPQNNIYQKVDRSGCMPCTAFKHWEEQLSKTNLRMYRHVQHLLKRNLIDEYQEPLCIQK